MKLGSTQRVKPTGGGSIESFTDRLRDEFLNVSEFIAMQDARENPKAWQHDHNHTVRMARSAPLDAE